MSDWWQGSSRPPDVGDGDVHVWRASLDVESSVLDAFSATLSAEESVRASRLATSMLRNRFVAGRGLVRRILGSYLDRPPASIRLCTGPQGKPAIEGMERGGLRFNASNAAGLALVAVARGRDVGVDVEELRPVPDAGAIVDRFFASAEARWFRDVPDGDRSREFLRCWTRKEAYVKAVGAGLSMPLSSFAIMVEDRVPRVTHADDDPNAAARWSLRDLDPWPGYVGALAVEGQSLAVRLFAWEPRMLA